MLPDRSNSPITPSRIALACLVAGAAWIVCEVVGGLAFLALGVRLWRYELMPIWWEITSPIVWIFALFLIVPLTLAFEARYTRHVPARSRLLRVAAFVGIVGPALEVAINEFLFKAWLGRALYEYTLLPTFSGSGSWVSPLYYLTLLIHMPITDRILRIQR
jgi:hypothetical protein